RLVWVKISAGAGYAIRKGGRGRWRTVEGGEGRRLRGKPPPTCTDFHRPPPSDSERHRSKRHHEQRQRHPRDPAPRRGQRPLTAAARPSTSRCSSSVIRESPSGICGPPAKYTASPRNPSWGATG